MKSYLACVNQGCLDIITVYKKMKLSNDNCILSVGLAPLWFSLVRWSSISSAEDVRRSVVPG